MRPDGVSTSDSHIFYTAMGNPKENNGAIYRVDLDGSNNQVIVPHGATFTPKQLQVEAAHNKLYWCDREGMRVFRANLNGSDIEVLVTTGTSETDRLDSRNWCVGIAIDPLRRLMYWTQKGPSKGNEGRLFCAGLDIPVGQDTKCRTDIRLLLAKLPEPIDLDFDPTENALYLTDRGDPPFGNSISRIKLAEDGSVEKTIIVRKLHEAIGLALDVENRTMYFTDLGGSLYRSSMDGADKVTLIFEYGDLTGVACLK
jgi:sugar lactone lactonase YvrE